MSDPSLWSVRVNVRVIADCCFIGSHVLKPGYESEIVLEIAHRTMSVKSDPIAEITTAFAREGIPGYVFLEGELPEVAKVVHGISYVFRKIPPRLVQLEQRVALLEPRNPLSEPIKVAIGEERSNRNDIVPLLRSVPRSARASCQRFLHVPNLGRTPEWQTISRLPNAVSANSPSPHFTHLVT